MFLSLTRNICVSCNRLVLPTTKWLYSFRNCRSIVFDARNIKKNRGIERAVNFAVNTYSTRSAIINDSNYLH